MPDRKTIRKYVDRLLEETPAKQRFPHLEYFGQMHGTYLFAQSDEGLLYRGPACGPRTDQI